MGKDAEKHTENEAEFHSGDWVQWCTSLIPAPMRQNRQISEAEPVNL